jgi:hypothetical protein
MIGNTIPHYRIVGKLGGGGLGALQDESCTTFLSREAHPRFFLDARREEVAAGQGPKRKRRGADQQFPVISCDFPVW